MNTSQSPREPAYDGVARFLHWLIAALIVAQFVLGWTMPHVRRDTQPVNLIAWHLGVGSTLLAVMLIRVIWRATHRPPPHSLSPVLHGLSRATHFFLYVVLIGVPLLGWANASARGWHVKLLGLLPLPALSAAGSHFGRASGGLHTRLAWVLFALICLHVTAALFHRFVLKDKVLQRMLP
jgi:cytochrome b561